MSNQPNPQRVVTGEVRLSYVHLVRPKESQFNDGASKYSVTVLVPKSDVATKQRIDAAINAAIQKGISDKWNGVRPPMISIPIHDGDGVRPSDGMPFGEECKGHWVFTATASIDDKPEVVDLNLNPIMNPSEIYSGMYARIAVNFSPYFQAGKKGVGAYISKNIQKMRDGEPLSGSAASAADDFGGGQAPAPQHPAYGQQPPAYPPYGQPPAAPTQQPMYGQPATAPTQQPQYGQQPYGQQPPAPPQQPQFDPITGAPLNGGVYGI